MSFELFILAFGWTLGIASTRIQLLIPGEESWLFVAPPWRIALAAGLVVAEASMIVWAFAALSAQMAFMILIGGFGVGMLSIKKAGEHAVSVTKPLLDGIAILAAACLWSIYFPL